ncbi:MAG: cupin domain-containing protein [Proteobacteria bacterium]|nr:cupin domain-containing protein [Pseudomonadota bacterium]
MSKIDIASAPQRTGSDYPKPYDLPCAKRHRTQLGDAAGLTDFGANLLRLPPGTWSSQRHWHDREDEFIYVVAGEVALVTDEGETVLKAGDCAGFAKNVANGHHLINKSNGDALVLEVGTRTTDDVTMYADIDMKYDPECGG